MKFTLIRYWQHDSLDNEWPSIWSHHPINQYFLIQSLLPSFSFYFRSFNSFGCSENEPGFFMKAPDEEFLMQCCRSGSLASGGFGNPRTPIRLPKPGCNLTMIVTQPPINNWQLDTEQLLLLHRSIARRRKRRRSRRRRRRRGGGGEGGGGGGGGRRSRRKQRMKRVGAVEAAGGCPSPISGFFCFFRPERSNRGWYRWLYHNEMLLLLARRSAVDITAFSRSAKRVFNWRRSSPSSLNILKESFKIPEESRSPSISVKHLDHRSIVSSQSELNFVVHLSIRLMNDSHTHTHNQEKDPIGRYGSLWTWPKDPKTSMPHAGVEIRSVVWWFQFSRWIIHFTILLSEIDSGIPRRWVNITRFEMFYEGERKG